MNFFYSRPVMKASIKLVEISRKSLPFLVFAGIGMSISEIAAAAGGATDIGGVFTNVERQTAPVAKGLTKTFYAMGTGGAGVGVWKVITRRQRNEGMGEGLTWAGGGAVLLGLGKLVSVLSGSLYGTDATSSEGAQLYN